MGFRVWGLGFRVARFRVYWLGFRFYLRVPGLSKWVLYLLQIKAAHLKHIAAWQCAFVSSDALCWAAVKELTLSYHITYRSIVNNGVALL